MQNTVTTWRDGRTLKAVSICLVAAGGAGAVAALAALAWFWDLPALRTALGTVAVRLGVAVLFAAVALLAIAGLGRLAGKGGLLDFVLPVVPSLLVVLSLFVLAGALKGLGPIMPCLTASAPDLCLTP